jgi:hypothetical protein
MNRKGLLVVVLAVVVAGGAFARPAFKMSAGAGGFFTMNGLVGAGDTKNGYTSPFYLGGGGFAFFDATYVELSVGFFGAGFNMSYTGLDMSLMGKYPFIIEDIFFLQLGIAYQVFTSAKSHGTKLDKPGDFNDLWIKWGFGWDVPFADRLYMRLGVTGGVRLPNKYEKDWAKANDETAIANFTPLHEVKIAIGYTF